ncbi:MAG: hypothetical protein P4L31_03350 [Candidatus Babeliales bacterium]|nr:hypothetical protein [Candidatus Babeliales bacterium]
MHKKIIFFILFSFFHLSSFGQTEPKMLRGGIMLMDDSISKIALSENEKDDKESKTQSLLKRLLNVKIDPRPLLIQSATVATLPVVLEVKNIFKDSIAQMRAINKFYKVSDNCMELSLKSKVPVKAQFYQLKAAANDEQAGIVFDSLRHDVPNRVVYGIPRVAFKASAGQLVPQMLSKDVYKQIVYRHIIYSLVDATGCTDGQTPALDTLASQFVCGATVEAVSWALTEYIFNQMEKNGYDPFKLPPYKPGKSELLYMLNPMLKNISKLVVYGVLSGYVVAPGYDKAISTATGRMDNEMKLCILSINFENIGG